MQKAQAYCLRASWVCAPIHVRPDGAAAQSHGDRHREFRPRPSLLITGSESVSAEIFGVTIASSSLKPLCFSGDPPRQVCARRDTNPPRRRNRPSAPQRRLFRPIGIGWGCLRSYLRLQQLRRPAAITWRTYIDPVCLDARLSTLLLAPLIENAVTHGLCSS